MELQLTQLAKDLNLYDTLMPETSGSVGIDLKACIKETINLHSDSDEIIEIPTGIKLWFKDPGLAGLILPRGSSKYKLVNTVGLIDSDYQGEYILKVHNPWVDRDIWIKPGDRIAQLVFFKVQEPCKLMYKIVDQFSETTSRGVGRNGSTGR